MIKLYITTIIVFLSLLSYSQNGIIKGKVSDAGSGETLIGVNVVTNSLTGVSTDNNGNYFLELNPGSYEITYKYIGYQSQAKTIVLDSGDTLTNDIKLVQRSVELDLAVVSAGRYEQKLSDVSVSMEIIKPELIENTNTLNLETAITRMPGIDVLDGQTSIRGGSGYSYGAGSRVMVLINDLPILTADVNEVKWNYLPVENIKQVEILKGASSALYGSSALNGVINIRTAYPETKPQTKLTLTGGYYTTPKREETSWWWNGNPVFAGASFTDSRKLGNFDLITGLNVYTNEGYREYDYEDRARANVAFRHRPEKVIGLTYGANTNIQWQYNSDFFIWQDADSGAFLQVPEVVTPTKGFRFNADPWVTYFDHKNNRHSLKTRYYQVYNKFKDDPDKNNGSDLYYGEYQFHKVFLDQLHWTIGMMGLYGITNAQLYGDHYNSNLALFTQLDYTYKERLSASFGFRWERYTLDSKDKESSPVIRAGLNYQVAKATFIRTSFGQGYRFPSIAEKYTATSLGSLNVFPNPDLNSEKGWSAEVGLKQGIKINDWNGFIDVAGFWSEYTDMIEFTFGVWTPDSVQVPSLDDLGFKSLNVGHARVNGMEIGITGQGKLAGVPLTMFAGYTYMNPIDVNADSLENNILKYRYRHSVKGDVQFDIKRFSAGISVIYNSFMERIDVAFEEEIIPGQEIFPGLKEYRLENDKGFVVVDLRLGYQISPISKLSVIANNIFNKEYMGRPGDIQPPRNIAIQLIVEL